MGFTKDYLIDQENLENYQEYYQQQEEWRQIDGYPNYQISNQGRVQNILTDRILKQLINTKGYKFVVLYLNNIYKNIQIHRLIAKQFIDNPQNLQFVDHIDGNRQNNSIFNLRWVTQSQNSMNQKKQKRQTSSIYKGVTFNKQRQKWISYIKKDQKRIYLGHFDNQIDAARAYDQKAKEFFKEFAKLNFSD